MPVTLEQQLLFGLLALQNGLIDQAQFVTAFQAWTRDKARTLSEHLSADGDIEPDDYRMIEALVARHLQKHGDDAEKSLASLAVGISTREALAAVGDPLLEATLELVGSGSHENAESTSTFSVGTSTTEDQRFRVLRPHARGGLGAVFVALDSELNREVALKQILESHADDATSRQRFLLEAEITGGLEHPGIVPVYGLGTYGDGRPFYAMRFIRGDNLKDAITHFHDDETLKTDPGRRSLELRKLLNRFTDVCNAIDYAHSRGVLHRDIKPGNIIIGKHGETLVVDWGLAKSVDRAEPASATGERYLVPSSSSGSAETQQGSALGTPAYMSPEQARGDLDALGPRSDVYSLGATLYYLLTGKVPFAGHDMDALLGRVKTGDFPRPRTIAPAIDKALEAVCLQAMSTKPEDRYASCQALADDVERWAADEPVTAWQEPFTLRARRWARRNRTAVISLAASVLVALVGTAAVLAVQTRANNRLQQANLDLENANVRIERTNAELSTANEQVKARFDLATEAIKLFHGQVGDDLVLKADQFKPLRDNLLAGAADFYGKLETLLEDQPDRASREAMSDAYFEHGELTSKIGDKPAALAAHEKGLEVRRELVATPSATVQTSVELARCLIAVGGLQNETGKPAEGLASYEEAREMLESLPASGPGTEEHRAELGKAYARIGYVLAATGEMPSAQSAYSRSEEILSQLTEQFPNVSDFQNQLALSQHYLAISLSQTGQPDEAMNAYQRSLAIRQKLVDDHPENTEFQRNAASSHNSMAILYVQTGRPDESLESFQRAQAVLQRISHDNPAITEYRGGVADGYHNIGLLQSSIGKYDDSLESLRQSVQIRQKLVDENPTVTEFRSRLAMGTHSLGNALWSHGQLDDALESLRKARGIRQQLVDENPTVTEFQSRLAGSHNDIGIFLSDAGQPAEALESYNLSLAIERRLADENPAVTEYQSRVADTLLNIAGLTSRIGKPEEALESYRESLAIKQKLAGENPADPAYRLQLAASHNGIGNLLKKNAQPVDALVELRLAEAIFQDLATANPTLTDYRNKSADCLTDIADVLLMLNRSDEARESYEQAIKILETLVEDNPSVFMYAASLAHTEHRVALFRLATVDDAAAVTSARKAAALFEGLPSRSGIQLFELACCHAALFTLAGREGSGISASDAEAAADKAIETIRQAIAEGFTDSAAIANHPALDPLRNRPDFQVLIQDLP